MILLVSITRGRAGGFAHAFDAFGKLGGTVTRYSSPHRYHPSPTYSSTPFAFVDRSRISTTASRTSCIRASLRDLLDGKVRGGESSNSQAAATVQAIADTTATPPSQAVDEGKSISSKAAVADDQPTEQTIKKPYTDEIITISDAYDSGNGVCTAVKIVDGEADLCDLHVYVKIRPDPFTDLEKKQHFQVSSFDFDPQQAFTSFKSPYSLCVYYSVLLLPFYFEPKRPGDEGPIQ